MLKENIERLLVFILLVGCVPATQAQDEVISLWPEKVPMQSQEVQWEEKTTEEGVKLISDVFNPELRVFKPKESVSNGTSVIVFPGGGYRFLAIELEGHELGRYLASNGVTSFVLKYRLPDSRIMENPSIAPLQDAQKAFRYVRSHAEQWGLNPSKIGVMGFSAGGHLAALVSNSYDRQVYLDKSGVSARPDFSILIYPVITMEEGVTHSGSREALLGQSPGKDLIDQFSAEKLVHKASPKTFLIHATDDRGVVVENSLRYFSSLKEYDIPVEMHIYEEGGHGFGMGRGNTSNNWPEALVKWMQKHDLIELE